jgi:hypothetical protein
MVPWLSVWAILQHFWMLVQDSESVSSPPCHWVSVPSPLGWLPLLWENLRDKFWSHQGTWKSSGTNLEALLIRLVRTQVEIQACLRRQRGILIHSQWHPSNCYLWWNCVCQVQEAWWKYSAVWECESASLRHGPATKWVRSSNPWVCGKLIWSTLSPSMSRVYTDSLWVRDA